MTYRLTMRAAAKRRWRPRSDVSPEDQRQDVSSLPRRRRVAIIVDYDTGKPVMHVIEMLRTNRVDSYRVVIDGHELKQRAGWSRVCDRIRRAMPRLASARHFEG